MTDHPPLLGYPRGAGPAAPARCPLLEAVRRALDEAGYTWLRQVAVAVVDGGVVLTGVVPSYYAKQLAQVAALAVPGVGPVRNELQVGGRR